MMGSGLVLAVCVATFLASNAAAGIKDKAMLKSPSQWSDDEKRSFSGSNGFFNLCIMHHKGRFYAGEVEQPFSDADIKVIESELRVRGLSDFDISILKDRKGGQVFVGQSFAGLVCKLRRAVKLNKSFMVGVGHQWQAILPRNFVYLKGDGTSAGMFVYGWN
ncbi:hypothetical protein [Oceaniglobus ichthyenteri]|uniref:hypothetical protein n=1 Tax=Oceaniglobus ichthyenteri TaxID=2136177 RepID=UPI000D3BC4A3|nr:hypothetical protein [Oceaniglobus ichthyenteri]